MIDKQHITWRQVDKMVEVLARQVNRNFNPDVLVGISRGGLIPVRLLGDYLDIDRIGTMRVKRYGKNIGPTKNKPTISQHVSVGVKGKRVLLVDDVADHGHSLQAAINHLRRRGAAEVKVATFHFKPTSIVEPDFFSRRTTKWIVYPWERKEVERELEKSRKR